MEFRLTLYALPAEVAGMHEVLAWFTFEAPSVDAAILQARAAYGPALREVDCAVLRDLRDGNGREIVLKGAFGP